MSTETRFRLGELFSGPGGIALGAMQARLVHEGHTYSIAHQWANDYDKDTCETYKRNICPDNPNSVVCRDVRKLDITDLSDIDALAFGFPCNDFSVVGEQKGIDGVYGPLYSYGVNVLRRFRPKWFLAENVGGLKTSNDGKAFQMIIDELTDAGYTVVPHLYKFEKYEVPQARHRIIMIGIRNDLGLTFKVPIIPDARIITAQDAIENPRIAIDADNNELTRQSENVVERLRFIKPGQNAFTANLPKHLQLNVKGAKISQIYKRLDPSKPAYTVTGSGGGGTHIYHWSEPRALTNRERARLQTFPDDFIFSGSKESVRKQIGMAVPPKGVKVIFDAVLKTFAGIEYPHTSPNIEVLAGGLIAV
jgi:DNA (cytosine-5)-methyltransferase 1